MIAHVEGGLVRRARLGRSSMGEPVLYHAEALRIMGAEADGLDVDAVLWRAARRLAGYAPKGLGLSCAYLRPTH